MTQRTAIQILFISAYGDNNHSNPDGLDIPERYRYIVKPWLRVWG